MIKRQRTIKRPASLSGTGLHTGNKTTITFRPAPVDHGIVFVRTDLPGSPEIPADMEHVVDITRGTTLKKGEAKVKITAPINGLLENIPRVKSDSVSERIARTCPICERQSTVNTIVCQWRLPFLIDHA